jgi:hypothetical protein
MRSISLLIAGIILASCTTAPPRSDPPQRTASGQRAYESLLTGKVPGTPVNCVQHYNMNDTAIIDGHTIAFNTGPRTVYVVHLTDGCEMIDGGPYALVNRQYGGTGLCRGDVQQVADTMNRQNAGSCTVAEIVPYTKP